jgi:hypothetical protein
MVGAALCGCKPANVTDPIPTMRTLNVTYYASDEFHFGLTGIKTAIPRLREEGVKDGDFISIAETSFFIERQEIDMDEFYIIHVGKDSEGYFMFNDIIETQKDDITTSSIYKRQNIPCYDPIWTVESLHPIKVTVEMKIYIVGN